MGRDSTPTYHLHGLRVRSEVPLPAIRTDTRDVDLDIRWDRRNTLRNELLLGTSVASLTFADGRGYVLNRTRAGWTLRFHTVGEFRFDAELRRARVRLVRGGDPALIPLLVVGNVAALVLSLKGQCILHASAVEVGGGGLVFPGASGMGKSTTAALCCAGGARLITDDILRLEPAPRGFQCIRGPVEIRLRPSAASVADRLPAGAQRATVDGRLALRVPLAPTDSVPLRLLAIPFPSHNSCKLRIERLSRIRALFELTRSARIVGWRAPNLVAAQFARFGPVAANVPVYTVQIPWGPPFPAALASELLERLSGLGSAEHPE